jgi:hypothetical protein
MPLAILGLVSINLGLGLVAYAIYLMDDFNQLRPR